MSVSVDVSSQPILVGVGGDSGSGKTTLTAAFYELFGEDRITTLCLDDYHSLDRRERALVGLTPLNPRANNFALMEEQVWALKRGQAIVKPVYDHHDGTFKGPERLQPREIVIVQGLHPFLVPGVRHSFDLRVWLDPDPALRLAWKIQRDVAKRGYTREQVLAEIEARRPDAEAYIETQRKHADLVVSFTRPRPLWRDMGHLDVRITQRHTLPRLFFDEQLHSVDSVRLRLDVVDADGQRSDLVDVEGRIRAADAELIERNIWAHIDGRHDHLCHVPPERLGSFEASARRRRHSDPLALTQLILAHRILSAQKSELIRIPAHDNHDYAGDHRHV